MNDKKTTSLILIVISVIITTPMLTDDAYAKHEGVNQFLEFERHVWSRDSSDGHTGYLNCGTGTNSDKCALKIKVISGIQILSKSTISSEIDDVETHFAGLNKKMSIDKVTAANSYVTQYNLSPNHPGYTEYELHCTNPGWFWTCNGKDMHFEKMQVRINNNANEYKFGLSESSTASPQVYDVRKTLGHELFHAMGVDHNTSGTSIVFNGYTFGTYGYTATSIDKADLAARYP